MSMFHNFQKMLPYIQVKEIFYSRFQTYNRFLRLGTKNSVARVGDIQKYCCVIIAIYKNSNSKDMWY